ncbi:MAG: hypothetical protein ACNA8K_09820 [Cyclonatronaceae bacterium]
MIITSNYLKDFRTRKELSGSYEWWYFDACDKSGEWHIVVIFYDGCPFSPDYIDTWENAETRAGAKAEKHPAISVSVYQNGIPVFYSLIEYDASDFSWDPNQRKLTVGRSGFQFRASGNNLHYTVDLDEILPGGDRLKGALNFSGCKTPVNLFGSQFKDCHSSHEWNMSLPGASVTGEIQITGSLYPPKSVKIQGRGYHDHNIGFEPMKNEFRNWYWGRVHMPSGTLVYYIINRNEGTDNRAWFISNDNAEVEFEFDTAVLEDFRSNVFLLPSARKIILKGTKAEATIQMSEIVDSGPFYYRFISDAILKTEDGSLLETARGMSEFIHPSRIHNRLFRPLVNMRYHHKEQKPHWVQKNPSLYRWTW